MKLKKGILKGIVYLNLQIIPMNRERKSLFVFIQRLNAKIKCESQVQTSGSEVQLNQLSKIKRQTVTKKCVEIE